MPTPTGAHYPEKLDAFLPLMDGHHPVTGDDFNILMTAIERVQTAAGSGSQPGSIYFGPKGQAQSVTDRLNNLLAADGSGIIDFVFITGTMPARMFSELNPLGGASLGVAIPFGKDLSGTDQLILFGTAMPGEEADGTDSSKVLGAWCVSEFTSVSHVRIAARLANGAQILVDNDTMISWGLLVFGPKAWY